MSHTGLPNELLFLPRGICSCAAFRSLFRPPAQVYFEVRFRELKMTESDLNFFRVREKNSDLFSIAD
jgi:hypothetical protein